MPIGIEKIVVVRQGKEHSWGSFFLTPEFAYELIVKYYPETPEAMKGFAKWVLKPKSFGLYASKDQDGIIGDKRTISMLAKFCGPKRFVIEAFLNEPTNSYPQQLEFWGKAPEKIISTAWSKTNGGADIRGEKIKYGDTVWLNVQTEGLNGAKLDIDVYNRRSVFSNEKATTLKGVECIQGEVNVEINNTYSWREFTGLTANNSGEEFYVKISLAGKSDRILDDNNDDIHARFLTIEDKITRREVENHESAKPLTVGENEVTVERFELCHFKKITVTDDKVNITLFDEGKILEKDRGNGEFHFSETIHFDFDKDEIRADAKPVLNGVSNLLLNNPYVPAEIGAHCDIRGNNAYNDDLSKRRALSAVEYLVSKGVSRSKIVANGYGKRRLLIEGEDLTDEEHERNRRLTVRFKISGDDAESIVFQTIAPDETEKKKISFTVDPYQTDKCLRKGSVDEHTTNVQVLELTSKGNNGPFEYDGTSKFEHEVYSSLSKARFIPVDYILPHKSTTNTFSFYINSCRYYYNNNVATVKVKVYPDIKWEFYVFLNLSNDLSVKWQNIPYDKSVKPENFGFDGEKNLNVRAGKTGAERRWEYTDIDFGAVIQAKWNKTGEDTYSEEEKLTAKFDKKIKTLYKVFAQLKDASKYVTNGTKGTIAKTKVGSTLPLSFVIKPPNLSLGAEWQLARGYKNNQAIKELGTEIKLYFKAQPLIGLEITLDLLGLAIGATGPAAPILQGIRYWIGEGENIKLEMYVNLVLTGTIEIPDLSLTYNTASDSTDPNRKVQLDAEAKIELKLEAGLFIKAQAVIVVAEFYATGKAHIEGKGSVTFGHEIKYQNEKLTYRPKLQFDGLHAKIEVKAEVGMTIRAGWFSGNYNKNLADHRREYKNLVREFDIIKQIEQITGLDATINLIEKK
ncbi:OmpA family protein [Lacinutrix chionoecetis]